MLQHLLLEVLHHTVPPWQTAQAQECVSFHNLSQGQMQHTGRFTLVCDTQLNSEPFPQRIGSTALMQDQKCKIQRRQHTVLTAAQLRDAPADLPSGRIQSQVYNVRTRTKDKWLHETAACVQTRNLGARPQYYHSIIRPIPASEVFIITLAVREAATASTPGKPKRT